MAAEGTISRKASAGPLGVALASARANALPTAVLWAAGAATVLAWYFAPSAQAVFRPIARFHESCGLFATFVNRIVLCGLLPGAFLVAVKSLRPRRLWATIFANCIWVVVWGMIADGFFALQARVFGHGADFATLAAKVAVDKCIWSGCLTVPANSVFFFWEGRDFSLARVRAEWPRSYWRDMYLPVLLSDWMLWIPVQFMVYQFPLELQNQLVGLAGALWTLLGLAVGVRINRTSKDPSPR